jgi:hypothetical protein
MFLTSSSPWEGAAVVAPDGSLPMTGFYVATNSFPRNTVVDITNMETSKSTRAIVAGTLDSPGLLASVSREAAQLIGMRPGVISRIRMVQPSDPIAYLRFTESMESGIPSYDSGNVITEDNLRDLVYGDDPYDPSSAVAQAAQSAEPAYTPPPQRQVTGPSYTLEPEWRQRAEITDLYGFEPVTPAAPAVPSTPAVTETPPVVAVVPSEGVRNEIVKNTSDWIDERPRDEIVKDIPEYITIPPYEEAEKDVPVYITETSIPEIDKEVSEKIEESPREEVAKINPLWEEPVPIRVVEEPTAPADYNIVPSEPRPPSTIYGINPNDIIPGIVQRTEPPAPVIAPVQTGFSVPRINSLESGKYYVQLAALDTPESVENALKHVDHSFKPVIYTNGDSKYRLLLGPLNQGESAAVLQRFKSIGYADAFVRAAPR